MKTLIKTLHIENGELYTVTDGRRILLSVCPLKIELYEIFANTPVLGVVGYEVKVSYNAEVSCNPVEFTRLVDVDFLKTVSRYEIVGAIQKESGEFERLIFDCIRLARFDLPRGIWAFDVTDDNMIQKLLGF